jgi:hypothetical protein
MLPKLHLRENPKDAEGHFNRKERPMLPDSFPRLGDFVIMAAIFVFTIVYWAIMAWKAQAWGHYRTMALSLVVAFTIGTFSFLVLAHLLLGSIRSAR